MPKIVREQAKPEVDVSPLPESVLIELPAAPADGVSFPLHLNLQISGPLAIALRSVLRGYNRAGVKLNNGRKIDNPTLALRKILEDIADGLTKCSQ